MGGVVGGLGGAIILGLVGFMLWRRRHPRVELPVTDLADDLPAPPSPFPYQWESAPLFSPTAMSETAVSGATLTAKQLETMHGVRSPGASVSAGSSATLYSPASAFAADVRPAMSSSAEAGADAVARNAVPVTNPDVQMLLTHVENLQRAVRDLEETGYGPAPPEYRSEFGSQ